MYFPRALAGPMLFEESLADLWSGSKPDHARLAEVLIPIECPGGFEPFAKCLFVLLQA